MKLLYSTFYMLTYKIHLSIYCVNNNVTIFGVERKKMLKFLEEISHSTQGCIYLIKNTEKNNNVIL